MEEDIRQLDLLSIFHYVVAGILAVFGLFPFIHLAVGIAIVTGRLEDDRGYGPPEWFGYFFIAAAAAMITMAWSLAVAMALSAGRLKKRVAYNYCLIVAGVECIFMPFGTVLGVFTIITLTRPSIRSLFGVQPSSSA